jgi:glycosyltransferase involved in cell wall biosynthesis
LKIFLVADKFYPSVGGGEKYVLNLASGLAERGHEVHVFTSRVSSQPQSEVLDNGLKVWRIKPAFHVHGFPVLPLLKIVHSDADIIHASGPSLNEDLFCPILKASRHKVVATYHADFIIENVLVTMYYKAKANLTFKLIDRVIVTTERYAEILRKRGVSSGKIRIIPPGVNEKAFKPPTREERAFLKEKYGLAGKVVLFVGGLDKEHVYKHPELLMRAFKTLLKKGEQPKLLIVGNGELREYYQGYCRYLGIEEHTAFLGRVPDDQLANLYKIADVFVLPSPLPCEGFGLVILEAMSSGCPVVVTKACGGSEVVQKTMSGIIVRPWSIDDLTEAMVTLLADENLRRKLGYNGRVAVEQTYNLNRVVDSVEQLYEELVEKN